MGMEMGRLNQLKPLMNLLGRIFLFFISTYVLFNIFDPQGFIFKNRLDGFENDRLRVVNEVTTLLSDDYQVTYTGKGFRANIAYVYLEVKSKNQNGVDALDIINLIRNLGFDERLCRNLEAMSISGDDKIQPDKTYQIVYIKWKYPDHSCQNTGLE